jgi:hypothetical protein
MAENFGVKGDFFFRICLVHDGVIGSSWIAVQLAWVACHREAEGDRSVVGLVYVRGFAGIDRNDRQEEGSSTTLVRLERQWARGF